VFGGIAGDAMAPSVARIAGWREPDAGALAASLDRALLPLRDDRTGASDLDSVRERLYASMWDDAGIVRDAAGLARADAVLDALDDDLERYRLPSTARTRAFNLTWHDWLNLKNLVSVSRAIVRAAQARENSRGAHYRADFPEAGDLATSTYTRVRDEGSGALTIEAVPVAFTRVRPGQSLI
jgi:fumarate reductase flavoprotein subunit